MYVPIPLFWSIAREIKLRNMGMIDPKHSSPLNGGSPSNDATETSGQSLSDIII